MSTHQQVLNFAAPTRTNDPIAAIKGPETLPSSQCSGLTQECAHPGAECGRVQAQLTTGTAGDAQFWGSAQRPCTIPPFNNPSSIVRISDPKSSHVAAADITYRGVRSQQAIAVLAAIVHWPGRTSRELAYHSGIPYEICHKRCPDLRRSGLVTNGEGRICEQGGRPSQTWYARSL